MLARLVSVAAVLAFATSVAAGPSRTSEAECGGVQFRVEVRNAGHPLENSYELSAVTSQGVRRLFSAREGGWFNAACVPSRHNEPLLVFQSYCGGSACVEDKYGAVNPKNLKLVLVPSAKNVSNSKELSNLLGRPAPYLQDEKGKFCCE